MAYFCKNKFSQRKARLFHALTLLLLLPLLLFSACKKKVEYFDYVSELRSNILLAADENFSLKIYAVKKESPYVTDGIPREASPRFEAYLTAPSGDKTAELYFEVDGKRLGGEMSYDNVKREYYYSCSLDISALRSLPCVIKHGETEWSTVVESVLGEKTCSPKNALSRVVNAYPALFEGLTDKYGFAGEIYLRLLYEDAPYYYIGVIDREGKVNAFLLNAESGKILARREG